ncbi:DNA repair protein RecO [Duganella phyllosphaerae]|uniref:DNA repair protein RecO n=1 Tax=Duganella phyllosphaerae TaxID=762836 RepID=A0A1E7X708_9BURK|nr:DNA repair protein RecO [Duganella phyllosphaerae]OFA08771.1 DNA repair protein RecO [Duganella phyllosphaerae]
MSSTTPDVVPESAPASPQQAAPDAQGGVVLAPDTGHREPAAPLAAPATAVAAVPAADTGADALAAPVVATTVPVTPASKRVRAPSRERTIGTKVAGQPAFVLHSYPYKETSLIIDLFTRDFGRVALIAKGAKRPHSQLRGVLQTFQPLSSSWVGKSELRTLTDAEWVGGMLPLEKTALLCGFYLNELLVKLLARDDAHPALFDHYVSTLNQLAHNEPATIVLRKFERALLRETGVAADLGRCTSTRAPVQAGVTYVVDPERGPRPERASDPWPRVAGKTLLDMEREDYQDAATQSQSKQLMRFLVAHHLNGAPLNTRQILVDLSQL